MRVICCVFFTLSFANATSAWRNAPIQEPELRFGVSFEQFEEQMSEDTAYEITALLEIQFTDGSKRTCTGTVIQDTVIITAAHCLVGRSRNLKPDVATSFAVIGSKRRFENGYELYLPIERVLIHPDYQGWIADIALVYTYVGIASEREGSIVDLTGEKPDATVDSNVTLLRWTLHQRGNFVKQKKKKHKTAVSVFSVFNVSALVKEDFFPDPSPETTTRGPNLESTQPISEDKAAAEQDQKEADAGFDEVISQVEANHKLDQEIEKKSEAFDMSKDDEDKDQHGSIEDHITNESKDHTSDENTYNKPPIAEVTTSTEEPMSSKGMTEIRPARHGRHWELREPRGQMAMKKRMKGLIIMTTSKNRHVRATDSWSSPNFLLKSRYRFPLRRSQASEDTQFSKNGSISRYRYPLRRSSLTEHYRLIQDTNSFISAKTCKKILDKALPGKYRINIAEVICYNSEDHVVTDEDSGAPALKRGSLLAVTVGGAQCDGEHVTVGMKMTCFCQWISENLPSGDNALKCCENCCKSEI